MKCQVNSNTTHDVLISKEIDYKSYKEICSGEKKKVNLGYWGNWKEYGSYFFQVENNSMVHNPRILVKKEMTHDYYIHGSYSTMSMEWEVLTIEH